MFSATPKARRTDPALPEGRVLLCLIGRSQRSPADFQGFYLIVQLGSSVSLTLTLGDKTGAAENPRPPDPHHRPKQGPPNIERMHGDPLRLLPEEVTTTPP